mmetsp:Transcript_33626/g.96990  ORF Transcript_33626/g.96990 Transcript_33626/m.96990 type:complete len:94 (+) Transcript_33626:494-775(+)
MVHPSERPLDASNPHVIACDRSSWIHSLARPAAYIATNTVQKGKKKATRKEAGRDHATGSVSFTHTPPPPHTPRHATPRPYITSTRTPPRPPM